MIDENELLAWAGEHRILSKRNAVLSRGEFYYAIDFVALNRKIREMAGIPESEVADDKKTSPRQQEV